MTKKTEKLILSVYKYCLKTTLGVKSKGISALEEYLYEQCLTESGEILFNKKVDKFLYWIMHFIAYDGYTTKANKNLLKSFSKMANHRTKLALNVASLCIDGMMNINNMDLIFIEVCSYVGVELYQKLWDIRIKVEQELHA